MSFKSDKTFSNRHSQNSRIRCTCISNLPRTDNAHKWKVDV